MPIVETRAITGGVDTHADKHVAAALDPVGGLLGVREFPATAAGYADLLDWLGGFGTVCLVGIEGTGSYGAGLARHIAGAGVRVVEVDRSDRQARRRQGKSDPLDAVSAARAGGFAVSVSTQRILGTVQATLALDGVPESGIRLTAKDLAGMDPVGLVIRLENRLTGLEALKTKTLSEIGRMRAEIARAREDSGRAFPQADQLVVARERAREIERQLEEAAKPTAARVVTPGSRQCRGRGHRISA